MHLKHTFSIKSEYTLSLSPTVVTFMIDGIMAPGRVPIFRIREKSLTAGNLWRKPSLLVTTLYSKLSEQSGHREHLGAASSNSDGREFLLG